MLSEVDPDPRKEIEVDPDPDLDPAKSSGSETLLFIAFFFNN